MGIRLLAVVMAVWLTVGCTPSLINKDIQEGRLTLNVPDTFIDSNQSQWDNIGFTLRHTKAKEVDLLWEGYGGTVDIMERFAHQIEVAKSQGKVIKFIIRGQAISAHAIAVCYGSVYQWDFNGVLIFHGAFYKGNDGHKKYGKPDEGDQKCLEKHIISQEDIDLMYNQQKRIEYYPDGTRLVKPDWT